ncbi:MAG: hypothetical protein ACR2QO_02400 [Acidimicrobiales bacterium]
MDLRGFLGGVRRRLWLVVLACIVGVAAVALIGQPADIDEPSYTVRSALALQSTEDESSQALILLYAHVITETGRIRGEVVSELDPDPYAESNRSAAQVLERRLWVETVPEIGVLSLTLEDQPDSATGERVLGVVADEIIEYARERATDERDRRLASLDLQQAAFEQDVERLRSQLTSGAPPIVEDGDQPADEDLLPEAQLVSTIQALNELLIESGELRNRSVEDLTPIGVVDTPKATEDAVATSPVGLRERMVAAVALSLFLSIGLATVLHRLDRRIVTRKDAEKAFGLPVLAQLPKRGRFRRSTDDLVVHTEPQSSSAETYRRLHTHLVRARDVQRALVPAGASPTGTVVLVTGATGNIGTSTTVANLAAAWAEVGDRVLVIGCELRNPTVHRFFSIQAVGGVADAATELGSGLDAIEVLDRHAVASPTAGITVLPHGPEGFRVLNPAATISAIGPLVDAARQRFDTILIDAAPLRDGGDVSELLPSADLVLTVAMAERTTTDEGEWLDEVADRLNAPLCGLVLTGTRSTFSRRPSGGGSGLLERFARRVLPGKGRGAEQPIGWIDEPRRRPDHPGEQGRSAQPVDPGEGAAVPAAHSLEQPVHHLASASALIDERNGRS